MPPETPPETPPLEAAVGRLDIQPWLTRRHLTPYKAVGLSTPFLRGLGLPAVLHLPIVLVVGGIGLLVAGDDARPTIDALMFVVFPVLEALACVLLALGVQQRRTATTMTQGLRAQSRFLGFLLTALSAFSFGSGLWEAFVVSALALLSLYAPTPVAARTDGKPWWYGT